MKKKIFALLAALFITGFMTLAIGGYIYGFILSCGQTIYREFDHQLTNAELAMWHDHFEEIACGGPLSIPEDPTI